MRNDSPLRYHEIPKMTVFMLLPRKREDVEPSRLLRGRRQFSESVMVSLGASFDGKTSILFIERGVKINGPSYCQDVLTPMLSEIRQKMPDFVFQEDGAPAHTAQQTVALLKDNCPAFIEPDRPPYNPDLNPIYYFIWSAMEEKVCRAEKIRDVAHLKSKIIQAWEVLPQSSIAKSILKWRGRMQAVVKNVEPFIKN